MSDAPSGDDAAMLRAFLAERDVPCPRCGYNLRAATGDVCVECGTAVRLGISPVEPVIRIWVVTVVFALIGAGFGVMFAAFVFGRLGMPPRQWQWLVWLSWACVPPAVIVVASRRRFLRLPRVAQATIAGTFAAVDVLMFLGLMTIR